MSAKKFSMLRDLAEARQSHNTIYCPGSINHLRELHVVDRQSGRSSLDVPDHVTMRIEIARLTDFIEYLFDHSEHCDHISHRDAWREFELWEINKFCEK